MRPEIICHMVSSIDGRLLAERFSSPAAGVDGARLRRHYDEVYRRFGADGWLVGRVTMEEFAHGTARTPAAIPHDPRTTHVADRKDRDVAVAIDPHGKLHYGQDNALGDHVIAVLGEQVSDAYLAELREDGVSYLFAGPEGDDLRLAMNTLGEAFGIKRLALQGGARINGPFLKAGLIDEFSVLVQPAVDGLAGVPSIVEYDGNPGERPAAGQSLRHLSTETLEGGMVWLRYRVEKSPSATGGRD